jgi:hypothetical protein
MTPDPSLKPSVEDATAIDADEWPRWCQETTADNAGRDLVLQFADRGIGELRLADGKPLLSIEYEKLGPAVAITITYGDDAVPARYVIAEPRDVHQHRDANGALDRVTIEDSTGRRTILSLA